MQWLLILLVAAVALSVLQHAVVVLVLILAILLIWGALCRPAETIGFLTLSMVAHFFAKYPGRMLGMLFIFGVIALLRTG